MRKPKKAKAKPTAKGNPKPTPASKRAGRKIIAQARAIARVKHIGKAAAIGEVKATRRRKLPAIVRTFQFEPDDQPIATTASAVLPIDQVKVGSRFRKDFGDLEVLTGSINDRAGLIHPIAVTPATHVVDGVAGHWLIAGERRLKAWQMSRFAGEPIPVRIIDIDSILAGEWDENAPGIRKNFSLSESVAIAEALLPLQKAKAAERALAGVKADPGDKGEARDKVASLVGMDRKTLDKARAVVVAARENSEFADLLEQMDRTGRAHGPFKRMTNIQQSRQLMKEPPPLPGQGPYRCGVIDLPWASEPDGPSPSETGRGYYQYPTMNTPEMFTFGDKVIPLLDPRGGYVWFWVTNFHLLEGAAFAVLDNWSAKAEAAGVGAIKRIGMRTWVKDVMGRGQVFRGQTEHVILCKFGEAPPAIVEVLSTRLDGFVRADSEKPELFYSDVEAATPATRYFELFARRAMPDNWDGFGDQVGKLAAPAAPPAEPEAPAPAKAARSPRKKKAAAKPAAPEPSLPGIPAPVENNFTTGPVEGADRDLAPSDLGNKIPPAMPRAADVRRAIDAKVEAAGAFVEVRLNTHPALYEAFEAISHDTGAGAGYAAYPVPQQHAGSLAAIEQALAALSAEEMSEFAIGDQAIADTIAARSAELGAAHGLLGCFARGWWNDDGQAPPPSGDVDADQLEIPAFLRRQATTEAAAS